VEHDESQTVNTAWVVAALTKADYNKEVIEKGVQNLMRKQLPNGDWKQEGISGVFNANCAISYSGYKNYMTIWALSAYVNKFVRKEPVVQL
jgi:lanosterol synthase